MRAAQQGVAPVGRWRNHERPRVNANPVSQTRPGKHVKSILFILGPSGVGKSHVSKELQKNGFLYVHIDTDRPTSSFAANGFPGEWDGDFRKVNIADLVAVLRARLDNEHAGTVVSFPTVDVFTPEMLREASELRATPIVLWGTKEHCMKAAEERILRKGMRFNRTRYERLNEPTFLAYGGREYDAFRIEAFREDGSRFPDGQLVANIMRRTAG